MRMPTPMQSRLGTGPNLLTPSAPEIFVGLSLAVALLLWIGSLPKMDPTAMNDLGLIAILPWSFWTAIAAVSIGFSVSLADRDHSNALRVAALIVLVVLLHATPAIAYGTLRYSWAWKHIGIIDYIQTYGDVDRSSAFLGAYHNWPGFFWLFAQLADWFGYGPMDIADAARFFPVLSNIVYLFLLRAIYRRFTSDDRLIHAGVWVFLCANWIGQDYFSPQAVAYAFFLLILLLCLGPLMPTEGPARSGPGSLIGDLRRSLCHVRPLDPPPSALLRLLALLILLLSLLFVASSHQLTPLILIFALCSLAVTTPLGLGLPTMAGLFMVYWVLYPASPFTSIYLPGEVAKLGETVIELTDTLVDTSEVDIRVAIVVWGGRALTACVALLAVFGWLRRLRWGARDGVICALLVAPTLTLGATSYGGEAVFRVFFFCLPFLAFLCAGLFFPSDLSGKSRATPVLFGLLSVLMVVGFLLGNNGKDRQYWFSRDEVAAAEWLYSRDTPDTLLVEVARNYPSQFMNYQDFVYLQLATETARERDRVLADPARILAGWFSDSRWKDGYVILSRSQQAYVEAMGVLPKGAQDRLAMALLQSPDFRLVYANRDARIFRSSRFFDTPEATAAPPDR